MFSAVYSWLNAASVGALMVDWEGERIDFAGGLVNFEGRGYALRYDEPRGRAESAVPQHR